MTNFEENTGTDLYKSGKDFQSIYGSFIFIQKQIQSIIERADALKTFVANSTDGTLGQEDLDHLNQRYNDAKVAIQTLIDTFNV